MPFTACHDQLIALFDQQNFAACEQQAAKQVAAHPQDAFAWKTLGAVRQIQGKLELAAPAMQQACTLWPDHAQNWNNYGNLLKQHTLECNGTLDEALAAADVVVYDALANDSLLNHASPHAEKIYVGKVAGNHALPQDEINALLVRKDG